MKDYSKEVHHSGIIHGRGYVYQLDYHVVWVTKYRKKVLIGQIRNDTIKFIKNIAQEQKIEIKAMEVMPDHIHLLISTAPQVRLSDLIKILKGTSAYWLFKNHPELKNKLWEGRLWNPSYFVATVSDRSEDQVKWYIENQQTAKGPGGRHKKQK